MLQGQRYPLYAALLVSQGPKFKHESLYRQPFWGNSQFETFALNYLKWPWTLRGKKYSHICYTITPPPRVPNFNSTATHFQLTGHFETIAQNDPKMALGTTSWKVVHIYIYATRTHNFHSFPFYEELFLRKLGIFHSYISHIVKFQCFFSNKCAKWPPKWPHACDTSTHTLPPGASFNPFNSMPSHFRVRGHFKTIVPNDLKH